MSMQPGPDPQSIDQGQALARGQRSIAPDQRPSRTWLAVLHHLIGLVIGAVSFPLVLAGVTTGAVLAPIGGSGLPILGLTLRYTDGLAAIERSRFAGMTGREVPPWPADPRRRYRWLVIPGLAAFTGRATWGKICYPLPRLLASVLLFPIVVCFWAVGLATLPLTTPLYLWTNPLPALEDGETRRGRRGRAVRRARAAQRGRIARAASATGGALLFASAPRVSRSLATADAALARWLLSPPADLAARVTELEISRERVVDAAEDERRRIERDLHDGAQQRLVALAMELGRAKAKFGDDPEGAKVLLDRAHIEAKAALTELRNLVRGVHPPILTERGLDPALSGLAALCPIPVDVHVEVPVRPKPAVEAVAYFMVAEALTNVAKHSRASHVDVVVEGHGFPGTLTVLVSDDGIGGADPAGAGLSGLADRVSGVDGELSVESPSGGPTMISAVLPCA
jgi:signal transduction histidine kinase